MRRPTPRSTGTVGSTVRRAVGVLLAGSLLAAPMALASAAAGAEEDQGETPDGIPRPFGDEVEPGSSYSDTAEIGPGTYSIPVPEEGQDQYFEIPRSDPDSVIWVGATLQLEESPDEYASFTVEGTAEGDSTQVCNNSSVPLGELTFATTLFSANRSGECRQAETIVVRVANGAIIDESDPLPTDAYYQLTVWTEPPVGDTSRLPAPNENSPWEPLEEQEGEPQEIEGARTFSEATPLEDGYYTTVVRKGRSNIFAFPLTYGQHAQVLAEMDGADDYFSGLDGYWVSPLGGRLRTVDPSGGPTSELGLDRGDQAGWSTPIVTYTNRQRAGGVGALQGGSGFADQTAAPAVFAGTYYLVLEIPVEFEDPLPDELPVILDVRTVTDYEGSPPDYVVEPTALQALDGSGYVATESEEQAAREDEAEPAPWPLVLGLFGGAAVLAVIGGIAVGRVVRSRS